MSTTERFVTSRASGKSNAQVVIELVQDQPPETTFTFEQLAAALEEGAARRYTRQEVCQCVRLANHRLLREHRRVLRSVRGVGYLLAPARDHAELAGIRTGKGRRQLKWALETMENVRLDEMTEQQRTVHLAQQAINSALSAEMARILRQQQTHAQLIAGLSSRLDQAGL